MLLHLRIRDFAIIDAVEVELPPGFTVVTGETGAGKSILVDALMVAMGARATQEVIRDGAESAEVEALFDIRDHPLVRARLESRDLVGDDPHTLVIRRVVGPRGKAKVTVNGRLATVATLGELVRGLVDISGQHEQQSLLVVDNHLEILDAYGQLDGARCAYREAWDRHRACVREADRLRASEQELLQRADFLRYQVDEIGRVSPRPGEDVELEAERELLTHAEKLRQGAAVAEALLYGEDGSAFDKLGKVHSELTALSRIDASLAPVCDALARARGEVDESARTLGRYASRIEADPTRLDEVEARLGEISRLVRKHGGSIDEALTRLAALSAELDTLTHADARLAHLEVELRETEGILRARGAELTALRRQAAARLDAAIIAEVADMDLPGAVFRTEVAAVTGLLPAGGLDAVEFSWSANPGEAPRALARIASGGELSRLMLAVKGVLRARDLVSVYVFDEVDTGLGGKAADSIGRKIQAVARGHQALTITHLAPIAARADTHLRVRKESRGDRTVSSLEAVKGAARAEEVARMIDGAAISRATRQAARAMLSRRREMR